MRNLIFTSSLFASSLAFPLQSRSSDNIISLSKRTSKPSLIEGLSRQKYYFPITVESQTFDVEIDTGSSDTWITTTTYTCYQDANLMTGAFLTQTSTAHCGLSDTYSPGPGFSWSGFDYLTVCYGQSDQSHNRCVGGPLGVAAVTLGDLTVSAQRIGAIEKSSFPAHDSIQSGILGLAFPPLATTTYLKNNNITAEYHPIMQNAFSPLPKSSQYFALALSGDDSHSGAGGLFSISSLPSFSRADVNVSTTARSATAPLQAFAPVSTEYLSFYAFTVDSYNLATPGSATQKLSPSQQVILDSGASTVEVPLSTSLTLNSQWSPAPNPSTYSTGGAPALSCDAVFTGTLSVQIGGQEFAINPKDLKGHSADGKSCFSLIEGSADAREGFLLGDAFLKNVLAVFDWGNERMQFWPRSEYAS